MNVVFQTKSQDQNRFTMPVEGYGKLYFKKGAYITSDKELIEKLINHPLKKRGEYTLVTNDEVVAQYLEGDEPDTLTREILDNVSMEGMIELGKVLQATESNPTLIKVEIVGEPITDQVKQILDFYSRKRSKDQVKEEKKSLQDQWQEDIEEAENEEPEKVKEVSLTKSGDMKASEAIDFIETAPRDELESFLSEDEDRVTIKRAYEEKMSK